LLSNTPLNQKLFTNNSYFNAHLALCMVRRLNEYESQPALFAVRVGFGNGDETNRLSNRAKPKSSPLSLGQKQMFKQEK
jgi:hypothetical protein